MPVMSLSMPAFLLGLHAIQGVLGNFQLPAFIQTLSKDKPNGQGDRMFTLPPNVINVDDFKRFTPRKRHLKTKKLLKRLGDDFDPFWMSVDLPEDLLETHVKHTLDTALDEQLKDINLTALESTIKTKFGSGGDGYDPGGGSRGNSQVVSDILSSVKSWLIQTASCPVYYRWEDQGLLYWPRWVRRGMCSLNDAPLFKLTSESGSKLPKASSCSWPPGMHCVPGDGKRLKILRWQCRHNKALNNFNRFQLPGMIPPRNDPFKSLPGSTKTQHHPGTTHTNQHSIKHHSESPNVTSHSSQHPKRRGGSEDRHPRRKREASRALGKTKGHSKSPEDYTVHIADRDKHPNSKTHSALPEKWKGITGIPEGFPYSIPEGFPYSIPDGFSPATQKSVDGSKQRGEGKGKKHSDRDDKKQETDGNDTENWNRMSWKQRRRTLDLKCKWIKIPYPVTDSCFCSC